VNFAAAIFISEIGFFANLACARSIPELSLSPLPEGGKRFHLSEMRKGTEMKLGARNAGLSLRKGRQNNENHRKREGKKMKASVREWIDSFLAKKNKQINLAIDIYNFIKESFPERIDHASVCEIINVYLSEN